VTELVVAWALLSTGVLLIALEMMFGALGSIGLAILWPLILGVALVALVICAAVGCVVAVCWCPVGVASAVFGRGSKGSLGSDEQVGGVSK